MGGIYMWRGHLHVEGAFTCGGHLRVHLHVGGI